MYDREVMFEELCISNNGGDNRFLVTPQEEDQIDAKITPSLIHS